ISSRPTDAKERAVQEIYRSKLLSAMLQAGYPEQIAKPLVLGFAYQPGVAITFRVEEIFLQTPGPAAGKKISSARRDVWGSCLTRSSQQRRGSYRRRWRPVPSTARRM